MIKRYHEAPLSIFHMVQEHSDGDYALVHLLSIPSYRRAFEDALAQGREVILDNSLFELGKAFDGKRFAEEVLALKPTYYIVPDVWKNSIETVKSFDEFLEAFPDLPDEGRVGVAQGETIDEVAYSYRAMVDRCDMIAFNFDFSNLAADVQAPKRVQMSIGRMRVIQELDKRGVLRPDKKHHLLGCGVPSEIQWMNSNSYITSIDTCHPVMTGMMGFEYSPLGFNEKCQFKMCDHILDDLDVNQRLLVMRNLITIENWLFDWR